MFNWISLMKVCRKLIIFTVLTLCWLVNDRQFWAQQKKEEKNRWITLITQCSFTVSTSSRQTTELTMTKVVLIFKFLLISLSFYLFVCLFAFFYVFKYYENVLYGLTPLFNLQLCPHCSSWLVVVSLFLISFLFQFWIFLH